MLIVRTDPLSGVVYKLNMDITEDQLYAWLDGMPAQKAFPNLNVDDIEYIISGTPPGKWDDYMGKER